MKRNIHAVIAAGLLLAVASPFAANAAGPASASTDAQFAIFMRNLETTDGAPLPPEVALSPSDTNAPRTVWSDAGVQAQSSQKQAYQFEQFEKNLAQGSSPSFYPYDVSAGR